MEMKHFTTEEWIDFVNRAVPGDKQRDMQEHLGSGCRRCGQTVNLWEKIRTIAAETARYQPPDHIVRAAKAQFAIAGLGRKQRETNSLIEVLFDSFSQPALAGARSAGAETRQMLYRAEPYQIDVQIEAQSEGNRLVVTGQLMDARQPEIVGRDVLVTLSNRHGHLVKTVTNQFGEFHGEINNSGDVELSFSGPDEKSIVISLRDALRRVSGDRGC
jgi:hypothetical protein